jgi:hypothetical protein
VCSFLLFRYRAGCSFVTQKCILETDLEGSTGSAGYAASAHPFCTGGEADGHGEAGGSRGDGCTADYTSYGMCQMRLYDKTELDSAYHYIQDVGDNTKVCVLITPLAHTHTHPVSPPFSLSLSHTHTHTHTFSYRPLFSLSLPSTLHPSRPLFYSPPLSHLLTSSARLYRCGQECPHTMTTALT